MLGLEFSRTEKLLFFSIFIYYMVHLIDDIFTNDNYIGVPLFQYAKPETLISWSIFWLMTSLLHLIIFVIFFILTKYYFSLKTHITFKKSIVFMSIFFLLFWILLTFSIILASFLYLYLFHKEVNIKLGLGFFEFIFYFCKQIHLKFLLVFAAHELKYPSFFFIYILFLNLSNSNDFVALSNKLISKLKVLNSKNRSLEYGKLNLSSKYKMQPNLEYNNDTLNENPQIFMIKKIGKFHLIHIHEILSFESNGNYLNIDTGNELYPIRSTFKKMQEVLPKNFIRINRFYIINLLKTQLIELCSENKRMNIQLTNLQNYEVAKNREEEFIKCCIALNLKIINIG